MHNQTYAIELSQFYNPITLNIFSDASIIGKRENFSGCYGVACITQDQIIDTEYRIVSPTTVNNCELKGIRCAISKANKYKDQFKFINIFSDSKISLCGLNEYIYNWRYNESLNKLVNSQNNPIANQDVFIECYHMLINITMNYPNKIRLFHQSGHVNNDYIDIKKASQTFSYINHINGEVDFNLIRYISTYNNLVDNNSRSYLKKVFRGNTYCDPLEFYASGKVNKI